MSVLSPSFQRAYLSIVFRAYLFLCPPPRLPTSRLKGHAVVASVSEALDGWCDRRVRAVEYVVNGNNMLTEVSRSRPI